MLQVPWAIFADTSGQFSPAVQLATVSRFLLPALLASSVPVLVTFYTSRLDLVLKNISAAPKGSEECRSSILTARMCSLHLVSALYSRLEAAMVHGHSEVTGMAAVSLVR